MSREKINFLMLLLLLMRLDMLFMILLNIIGVYQYKILIGVYQYKIQIMLNDINLIIFLKLSSLVYNTDSYILYFVI